MVANFSGVAIMDSAILGIRLAGIAKAIRMDNISRAVRMVNDTLRIFRTAKKNTLDKTIQNIVMNELYRILIYVNTYRPVKALMNVSYLQTINALPNELF
jgi:hypothetical protein